MKYDLKTIEKYLEVIPLERKEIMLDLIALVKKYFHDIKGNMEYNMPTFNTETIRRIFKEIQKQ
jgi:hypothetical protein